jgi:hypothetical protein
MRWNGIAVFVGALIHCLGTATAQTGTNPPAGFTRSPLTVGGKFAFLEERVFGPRALAITAVTAGFHSLHPTGSYPEQWSDGAAGFGRFAGDRYARRAAQYTARFAVCAALREDPRYERANSSGVARVVHAIAFTFVDRTDGGRPTLAVSNFAGATASGFVGNAYLPDGFRDATHGGQRALVAFGSLAARNVAEEFAPELTRGLRHLHLLRGRGIPEWWTSK